MEDPTRQQMAAAWKACGCRGDFDQALACRALYLSLKNVALAMFSSKTTKPKFDWKRASAGDFDD